MNRYKIVFLISMLFLPICVTAQKKQMMQARDQIKEGKNLDKAENAMRTLLKDSANRTNIKIWLILTDALKAQYAQANEKLYLQQKQDTASLFQLTRRLFDDMNKLDTLDARPNKKGRVVPVYRERNSVFLNTLRPNLYQAGVYYAKKKQYEEAYRFFNQYILCSNQPLFSNIQSEQLHRLMPQAAYGIMLCGNRLLQPEMVLRYATIAQEDTSRLDRIWQYMAEAYLQQDKTTAYADILRKGVKKYPTHPYFFPRLIAYEQQRGREDEAKKVVDYALAIDSTNVIFRLAKTSVLLNLGRYDECAFLGKGIISENDSIADAYYYVGLAYFNKAIMLEKQLMFSGKPYQQRLKAKKTIAALYEKSRPYLERYRQLAPDMMRKWSAPLYTIYFKLNMGKEFDEIDKLRNEHRKNIR